VLVWTCTWPLAPVVAGRLIIPVMPPAVGSVCELAFVESGKVAIGLVAGAVELLGAIPVGADGVVDPEPPQADNAKAATQQITLSRMSMRIRYSPLDGRTCGSFACGTMSPKERRQSEKILHQ